MDWNIRNDQHRLTMNRHHQSPCKFSPFVDHIIWTILTILLILCTCVHGFNIDTRSAVVHEGRPESMFGYSVALHRDKDYSWLLIGAPKTQTDQPNVVSGGAVYRCSIDSSNICQIIPFDTAGPGKIVIRGVLADMDDKSHQWFGATVHSSGENGAIVACAPRYVYFSSNMKKRDPVGTCWVVRGSFTNFQEYSPCRTTAWGYHRQGSCQAGMSAAVTKDGRRLFVGAVGSWYWQGQLFSQDLYSKEALLSTSESPEKDDDSYLGYSMSVGEFTGDQDPDVVVGVPRGSNLTGKVALFTSSVANLLNISGEQLGSYFGYAVCVSDVNGDGLDDIIVGAPLYTDLNDRDGSYETGRVYVFYQTSQHQFVKSDHMDGDYSRGRLGTSVASVADINKDGYNDIVVGCPYGGEGGEGVVYLYHGSKDGIVIKPVQEITASSIPNTGSFQTFGWSLSGGLDLDNNQYPDILIGAYSTDKAVFLRSRPVVQATSSLKITPEKINLDDKKCKLGNGVIVSCVVVSFCLEFTGIGIPATIDFVYNVILDAQVTAPRVYFLQKENKNSQNVTARLRKESRYCNSEYAYIQVNVQKNCGLDNICIPDIKLQIVPNMHQFLIGDDKRLQMDIVITNEGEDAFEAMLYGHLPIDVDYVNIAKVRPMDIHVSCSEFHDDGGNNKDLICDIGNPLPSNTTLTFTILFAPSKFLSTSSDLRFNFVVNSTNEEVEDTQYDNHLPIILPVRVEVNVTIHGLSEPQSVSYNKTEVYIETKSKEADAGPEVIHVYAVVNRGPSKIKEAEVNILWPTYTLQNRRLLYLMEQPEVQGNGRCEHVSDVNPLFLKTEQKKPRSSGYSVSLEEDLRSSSGEFGLVHIFGHVLFREEREKRSAERNNTHDIDTAMQNKMICGPTFCTKIKCTLFDLKKGEQVIFTIRSRLWRDTLVEMGLDELKISSKLVSRITSLPHDIDPTYLGSETSYFVTTKVNPVSGSFQMRLIPWWVIILSVTAGLILLGLLVLLLWWVGFFRRRKLDKMKEPLNPPYRNGYHLSSGDEYL